MIIDYCFVTAVVCCRLLTILQINYLNINFSNTLTMSNGLDPDQDQRSVGPDLGPNDLKRLSADDKSQLLCITCLQKIKRAYISLFKNN